MAARRLGAIVERLPLWSGHRLARRLVARANAERDTGRFQSASALYEEALRLAPGNPRFHIQAGHMHKEAGDFAAAEEHYQIALRVLPDDPDLAMQLGHFYKLAERPDDAEAAYARAIALRPGWAEAQEELGRLAVVPRDRSTDGATAVIVPALLPGEPQAVPARLREGFHVTRLGATRLWTRGGFRRVLRGVEAVRGFVISSASLGDVELLIDGRPVARERLQRFDLPSGGQTKYVFNIWHDFGGYPLGPCQVELRVADGIGRSRSHRAVLEIVRAASEAELPNADGIVDPPRDPARLVEEINARPSMVRSAHRSPFPEAPRAILIQRVDQLGDLACSVPALVRMRALFPDAQLIILVTAANADLARTLDIVDGVVVADFHEEVADGRKVMTTAAQDGLRRTLAGYAFDIAIDLGETGTSRPLLLLSGAPFLYGFKDRDFPWLSAGFELNTHDPANHHEMSAVPRKLVAMVEALGAMRAPCVGATLSSAGKRTPIHTGYGLADGASYALLHTGARLAYTRWPGHAELARLLVEHTDLSVIVLGDEPLADLPASPRVQSVTGRIPFHEFDALIASASLFVGNDSGPKHLAALRGVPVVSLHMARLNWNEWGQDGPGQIVSRRVPCAGCGIGGNAEECGKGFACLTLIRPEEAFSAIAAGLAGRTMPENDCAG